MRAIAIENFGGKDRLKIMGLPTPEPGPDDVLVRVRAAGVGPHLRQREKSRPPTCSYETDHRSVTSRHDRGEAGMSEEKTNRREGALA